MTNKVSCPLLSKAWATLPPELHGGVHKGMSHLYDDDVEWCAWGWLANQRPGTVTPAVFHATLNSEILPSLCVILKTPICDCTAHFWLHKLGYDKIALWKGVYMDGHEWPDVVEYCNTSYLPKMLEYESHMTHYEGPDLIPHPPTLKPGEKHIISLCHDEWIFSANDYQMAPWYAYIVNSVFCFKLTIIYNSWGSLRTSQFCRRKVMAMPSTSLISSMRMGNCSLRSKWGDCQGCQGMSKAGSILDIWVPGEPWHICEGSLKGDGSLLNAWAEML